MIITKQINNNAHTIYIYIYNNIICKFTMHINNIFYSAMLYVLKYHIGRDHRLSDYSCVNITVRSLINIKYSLILILRFAYTVRTLCIHCAYIVHTLYVHCAYTVRTLCIHCTYIMHTLYVHCAYTVHTVRTHSCATAYIHLHRHTWTHRHLYTYSYAHTHGAHKLSHA